MRNQRLSASVLVSFPAPDFHNASANPRFCFLSAIGYSPRAQAMAGWQSGHAADCKSAYAGSIPTSASIAFQGASATAVRLFSFRPDGEIGRRKGLKIPHPQGYVGSSPTPGMLSFNGFSGSQRSWLLLPVKITSLRACSQPARRRRERRVSAAVSLYGTRLFHRNRAPRTSPHRPLQAEANPRPRWPLSVSRFHGSRGAQPSSRIRLSSDVLPVHRLRPGGVCQAHR